MLEVVLNNNQDIFNKFMLVICLSHILQYSISSALLDYADLYYGMQLLSGGDHDIDVDDLRKNTQYTGGYSEGSRTVKLFWEVLLPDGTWIT